ncbi:MAG: YiiX family permuted papain-like enzyme [Bacteroidota bacterium]|nr:YiiX family permuted papain-like enzyme [Bacteroidota bacterium]
MYRSWVCWFLLLCLYGCRNEAGHRSSSKGPEFQTGDLVFQISRSSQSQAIQLATGSVYSHVGVIYQKADHVFVLEAVQPVKLTLLKEWIERGQDDHYVVKRLKDHEAVLTQATLGRMKQVAQGYLGKDYDLYFDWSDERIYCSELVWKLYALGAGVELSQQERFGDMDLSDPRVRAIMADRYGENIPVDEPVVSPGALFRSALLMQIH